MQLSLYGFNFKCTSREDQDKVITIWL
jgi:hypothetical protein